ncbi:hypothetical protein [Microviridae sp.]|nr:hypothetical protein [Microviridae sp.]
MSEQIKETQQINPPLAEGKKRFRLQFDIEYPGTNHPVTDTNSATIPDMSLTVRQLLENHARTGSTGAVENTPIFFDMEIPTINDLTDVNEYKKQLQNRLNDVDKWINHDLKEAEAKRQNPPTDESGQTSIPE